MFSQDLLPFLAKNRQKLCLPQKTHIKNNIFARLSHVEDSHKPPEAAILLFRANFSPSEVA